jgi:uncharacterized FlaG/YvyC family protein
MIAKAWWDNRNNLNEKMATKLRDSLWEELNKLQSKATDQVRNSILTAEEVEKRHGALIDDLKDRVGEMNEILKKFRNRC